VMRAHDPLGLQVAAVFPLSSLAGNDLVAAWMLNRRELALPFVLGLVGLLVLRVALFVGLRSQATIGRCQIP
jgi:hypothetical protein